ncbi:MAG TPA: hypothetical protein VHL78_09420 [Actinomycetota bacterium]|nr:hypothetical protein [Actinomycetota bacterium]
MQRRTRFVLLALSVFLAAAVLPASAGHRRDPHTPNLRPLGHIVEPASLGAFGHPNPDIHTDIAFWGTHAFQGNWDGFNIRDISDPRDPSTVSRTFCDGNQGDVVVWRDVLVRSWNSPAPAGATCDGQPVPEGFEGVHIFDISRLRNPRLVDAVETECGSHTATGVPDLRNGRLLIYNSPSNHECPGIDIIEVPLDTMDAQYLRFEPAGRPCHDTGVILGDARLAACAGGDGFTVWTLPRNLANPAFLYSQTVPNVTIGHSAAFTWDGEVLVFGHEPGGGVVAECEADDPAFKKSAFFFEARTGDFLGMWTLPRPQESTENCTIHNFNVVPVRTNRYILVSGNYQAGTWVTDFTDPSNPRTVAWSDPPPLPVPPGTPFCCEVGGAWSTYWYEHPRHDDFLDRFRPATLLWETNITEGLNIFMLESPRVRKVVPVGHLNPQTQEFTLP